MRNQILRLWLLVKLTACASGVYAQVESIWRFSVMLDGRPIGEHHFTVTPHEDRLHVRSEADMQVNFLFFNAYSYTHRASEVWQGGCLLSIEAHTDNNDREQSVTGRLDDGIFRVNTEGDSEALLPGCIKSFAYWDSSFLQAPNLLNSQNGRLVEVNVTPGDWETIEASGQQWRARRYTLTGEKLHIELWYGAGGEWLRLASILPGNKRLDYHLIEGKGWNGQQRTVDFNVPPVRIKMADAR